MLDFLVLVLDLTLSYFVIRDVDERPAARRFVIGCQVCFVVLILATVFWMIR